MAVGLFSTATEYIANTLTITRGLVTDITAVGIYVNINPAVVPTVGQFTTVALVNGVKQPPDANSVVGQIDVLSLVGPRGGNLTGLTTGTYQVFILVSTAVQDIIRKVDTLTIT